VRQCKNKQLNIEFTKLEFFKNIGTTFLLTIYAVTAIATTWAPIYPYTQKTENGKVKSHSVPYGVNDGGYGPGETFVYHKGKLLYSIDKYFSSLFLTTNNGQYLIEINFYLNLKKRFGTIDESGNVMREPKTFEGKAINIYKDGTLFKTISFTELKIDTSMIKMYGGSWFVWKYNLNDTTTDGLEKKMNQHSAFIENEKLYLITADNQLISIDVTTGQFTNLQNAYKLLKEKTIWKPTRIKRKYKKVKYPDKFILPKLENGKTVQQGLAELLNMRVAEDYKDSVIVKIYFHTLLINKVGRCEIVYVSPEKRIDFNYKNDFNYKDDPKLKEEIEEWIKQQTFKTNKFPRDFQKYKYTSFIYLK